MKTMKMLPFNIKKSHLINLLDGSRQEDFEICNIFQTVTHLLHVTTCKSTLVTKITCNSTLSYSPAHTSVYSILLLYTYIYNIYKYSYNCYCYLLLSGFQLIARCNKFFKNVTSCYRCYVINEYTRNRPLDAQLGVKIKRKKGYNTHIQAVDEIYSAYAAECRCYIMS